MSSGARPIDPDTPRQQRILLWWRPIARKEYPHPDYMASGLSNNVYAECWTVGSICGEGEFEGKWWDGHKYQDAWHVTHWLPLPGRVSPYPERIKPATEVTSSSTQTDAEADPKTFLP